jgi:predicted signal transduction protein with EAL and GGDEF domain
VCWPASSRCRSAGAIGLALAGGGLAFDGHDHRLGGDEFVALLPETDPTGGWVLAEKIRLTVSEQGMPGIDPQPTVSVGVVSYPADGRSADALLVSADRAMYASKRGGKNRVARATAEPMVVSIEGQAAARQREADRAG